MSKRWHWHDKPRQSVPETVLLTILFAASATIIT